MKQVEKYRVSACREATGEGLERRHYRQPATAFARFISLFTSWPLSLGMPELAFTWMNDFELLQTATMSAGPLLAG